MAFLAILFAYETILMMNFISFSDVKEIEKLEENTFYLFDSEPNVGDFLLKNQYNICCKASL